MGGMLAADAAGVAGGVVGGMALGGIADEFFDDVLVPKACLVGGLNQGWAVAMHLLQFERGMYGWIRQSWLHSRLQETLTTARPEDAALVGSRFDVVSVRRPFPWTMVGARSRSAT